MPDDPGPRLLLVRTGSVYPDVARDHGDFDAWFTGADVPPCGWTLADPTTGPLPDLEGFDGCVITGSLHSVLGDDDWLPGLLEWTARAAGGDTPLLGVCFGHQLLARALGGRVERRPGGKVMGAVTVRLTDEGRAAPVFAGLPDAFDAAFSHEDQVVRLPEGARTLAGSDPVPLAAFAVGCAWGVQFHPEMTAAAREAVRARDPAVPVSFHGHRGDTEVAPRVLAAFVAHCARRALSSRPPPPGAR